MRINNRLKGIAIVLIGIVVTVCMLVFGETMEHIEDTNGPDNFSLATITEADVIKNEMNCAGAPDTTKKNFSIAGIQLSNSIKYESKKFSGIYDVVTEYSFGGTIDFTLYDFQVTGGNLQVYVVAGDQIIGTLEPGQEVRFTYELTEGAQVRLVLAGESAAFCFTVKDNHT